MPLLIVSVCPSDTLPAHTSRSSVLSSRPRKFFTPTPESFPYFHLGYFLLIIPLFCVFNCWAHLVIFFFRPQYTELIFSEALEFWSRFSFIYFLKVIFLNFTYHCCFCVSGCMEIRGQLLRPGSLLLSALRACLPSHLASVLLLSFSVETSHLSDESFMHWKHVLFHLGQDRCRDWTEVCVSLLTVVPFQAWTRTDFLFLCRYPASLFSYFKAFAGSHE